MGKKKEELGPQVYANEEELLADALREKLSRDPKWVYENHGWIKDKAGQLVQMSPLREAQEKLIELIWWLRKKNKPVRIIISKSRKQGISTIVALDCLMEVMRHELDAIILSHDKTSAKKIFEIYTRFYENWVLPKPNRYKGKTNLRELRFEEHDGHILVETGRNEYAGTALTPQYMHLSELSKWERGSETLVSLLQAIGDNPGTTLLVESTFNGHEEAFLPMWEGAVNNSELSWEKNDKNRWEPKFTVTNPKEWNGFIPFFISVLIDPDARAEFYSEDEKEKFAQTLDAYEQNLVDREGALLEFINWRRHTKKLKCQNDEDIVKQEWCTNWREAVRASGRPRFNLNKLDNHPVEVGIRGRLQYESDWVKKVVWKNDQAENLVRFRTPQIGHRYVIGADTAEGLEDEGTRESDNTVFIVLDLDNGCEQVAYFESKETPEIIQPKLILLGRYYNDAYLVIENNGQGNTVCVNVRRDGYPETLMFHRDDWNEQKTGRARMIGFRTTQQTRTLLISAVADAINDETLVIHSERTLSELRRFVYKPSGRVEAAPGAHDDHVFALGLALMGVEPSRRVNRYERVMASNQAMQRMQQFRKSADCVTGYGIIMGILSYLWRYICQ